MLGEAATELLSGGYTTVTIPGSFELSQFVIGGFQSFLRNISPEQRSVWSFNAPDNEDPDKSPDDGFISRGGEERKVSGGRYDAKFLFHYRPHLKELLYDAGIDFSHEEEWFSACDQLYQSCFSTVCQLTRELDRSMPEYGLFDRLKARAGKHVIRMIQYSPRGVDDPLIVGKKHADRNFLTLQVAESQQGLRIYPNGDKGQPIPYRAVPDTVLAFPSQKFETVTHGRIHALNHDIVNSNPVAPPRWSIIFFSHINLSSL